jgi:hypothetical protein
MRSLIFPYLTTYFLLVVSVTLFISLSPSYLNNTEDWFIHRINKLCWQQKTSYTTRFLKKVTINVKIILMIFIHTEKHSLFV